MKVRKLFKQQLIKFVMIKGFVKDKFILLFGVGSLNILSSDLCELILSYLDTDFLERIEGETSCEYLDQTRFDGCFIISKELVVNKLQNLVCNVTLHFEKHVFTCFKGQSYLDQIKRLRRSDFLQRESL